MQAGREKLAGAFLMLILIYFDSKKQTKNGDKVSGGDGGGGGVKITLCLKMRVPGRSNVTATAVGIIISVQDIKVVEENNFWRKFCRFCCVRINFSEFKKFLDVNHQNLELNNLLMNCTSTQKNVI